MKKFLKEIMPIFSKTYLNFKFSTIEIDDKVNNDINLEELKEEKISQDGQNNSLHKDIVIAIVFFSEEDKQINTKKIFLTVYPKKYPYIQKKNLNQIFLKKK